MEPEADEATKHTEIPSTSRKDSILATPTLPQELITAILVRLPVKYLLQFKCVSKEWFALISSPEFVKTHLRFSLKDSTLHRLMLKLATLRHCSVSSLFYESVTETFDLDYPMKRPDKPVRIVGSVNGLICLDIGSDGLVLWNPSTRKFKQLPDLLLTQTAGYFFNYGFGYDEVHDDYKVVAVFRDIKKHFSYAEISKHNDTAKLYSLKSDSWRTIDDFQGGGMDFERSLKLVNGKLHWFATGRDGQRIISIDLVDEKCVKVEQPCYGEVYYYLNLGVLGSDFSVACTLLERTDVWVMKEYGVRESWTKLYSIKRPDELIFPPVSPPLYMSIEGEILHLVSSTLTIYNPENDTIRTPEVTNVPGQLEAELYIESLVCPILQNEPASQH